MQSPLGDASTSLRPQLAVRSPAMATDVPPTAPSPRIYLAYVKRFNLENPRHYLEVLAGASYEENSVLDWIEEGKQIGHEIWYEDIPIDDLSHYEAAPREILVHFTGSFADEDYWNRDLQWSNPVGRKALVPEDFLGIMRPQPEREGTLDEDGFVGDDTYLWRVPCPWKAPTYCRPSRKEVTRTSTTDVHIQSEFRPGEPVNLVELTTPPI